MTIRLTNKKMDGFTLVEIVVATLVFAIAIAGLFATISSLNQPGAESFDEVQAAYLTKEVAEDLKTNVDADVWDETNKSAYNLVPGTTYNWPSVEKNGVTYTRTYNVTQDPDGGRWVNITVSW